MITSRLPPRQQYPPQCTSGTTRLMRAKPTRFTAVGRWTGTHKQQSRAQPVVVQEPAHAHRDCTCTTNSRDRPMSSPRGWGSARWRNGAWGQPSTSRVLPLPSTFDTVRLVRHRRRRTVVSGRPRIRSSRPTASEGGSAKTRTRVTRAARLGLAGTVVTTIRLGQQAQLEHKRGVLAAIARAINSPSSNCSGNTDGGGRAPSSPRRPRPGRGRHPPSHRCPRRARRPPPENSTSSRAPMCSCTNPRPGGSRTATSSEYQAARRVAGSTTSRNNLLVHRAAPP